MRGLPLLIRLARQEADERRAELVAIARAHSDAGAALGNHDRIAAGEAEVAATSAEARADHAAWLGQDLRRRAALQQRQAQLARTEVGAVEALRQSVAGLKRYETAQETADDLARRAAQRREAARADERETLRAAWRLRTA